MVKLASGQVYHIYSNGVKVGRATLTTIEATA